VDVKRLGGYEVIAPFGAGGMGEVHRARDAKLGRSVALKMLPASFTENEAIGCSRAGVCACLSFVGNF
jgi:serine/threonine protein kinase